MKNKIIIFTTTIILFFFQHLEGNINSKIIVKVHDKIITNFELKNKILTVLIMSNQKINQENIDNLKTSALNELINNELKKIELEKFKVQKDENRLNSYLRSISNNDINALQKKFSDNDISYEIFVNEIDYQLRWQKLIYTLYSQKININEDIVKKEVEDILNNKSNVVEFELAEIEIILEPGKNAGEIIEEVLNEIKTNGFENTAINFSKSTTSKEKGYLGWVNEKTLNDEVYQIVSKLNVGEIGEPLKKQNSVLFLKLINKKSVRANNIEKEKLKKTITDRKRTELFNLYSQSRISVLRNSILIKYL